MPKKAETKKEISEEELEEDLTEEELEDLIRDLQRDAPSQPNFRISLKSTAPVLEEIAGDQAPAPIFVRTAGREEKEGGKDSIEYGPSANYGEETSDTKYNNNGRQTNSAIQDTGRIDFATAGTNIRDPHARIGSAKFSQFGVQNNKNPTEYFAAPERLEQTDPFKKPGSSFGELKEEKTKKYEVR